MTKMGIRGQQASRSSMYPQPEGIMGDTMQARAKELGPESQFGQALDESGESFKQIAELRYALEENVKQNFLEPLNHTKKDITEVNHHRKKLEGRRLDFDCKKRKRAQGTSVTDEELRMAEEKFDESKRLTEAAMNNLIDADVERIAHLSGLVSSLLEYHKSAASVLENLATRLEEHKSTARSRPPTQRFRADSNNSASKPVGIYPTPASDSENRNNSSGDPWSNLNTSNGSNGTTAHGQQSIFNSVTATGGAAVAGATTAISSVLSSGKSLIGQAIQKTSSVTGQHPNGTPHGASHPDSATPGGKKPCCRALYDFEPENEGELPFKEGDVINLDERLDENWFVGTIRGKTGHFPVNYVQIIVDLP